jgi:Type II secretion system (T2SS), protein M subtype b
MARSKQPAISAAGRWGLAYVVAFAVMGAVLALYPFELASNLRAEADKKSAEMSLLTQRLEKVAIGSAAGSQDKLEAAGIIIHGDTVGITSAEIQRQVASIADVAGLRISRIQPVSVSQNGNAVALQLELEAKGSIESLQSFLFTLESGKPFVFVKEANIAVAGDATTSVEAGLPSIRMTLETTGWIGRI